jgi:hypothetical protein
MAGGSACGQGEQVMPVPDAIRILCHGGQALADHRLPLRIAGNGVSGPLDLDIHLQPDRARMVGHRYHIIEMAARDPLLQPHPVTGTSRPMTRSPRNNAASTTAATPVLVNSPRAARGQR